MLFEILWQLFICCDATQYHLPRHHTTLNNGCLYTLNEAVPFVASVKLRSQRSNLCVSAKHLCLMPGPICCAVMLDHFLPLCAEHPKDKGFYSVSLLPFLTKEGKLAFHLKSSKARLPNRRCMIRHREIYRSTKLGSKTHQEETYICQLTYRPCQHALI